VRPVDSEHQVPVLSARVSPPYDGNSSFVDVSAGLLGRAPIEPDSYDAEVRATGYTTETRSVTVNAGQWTDLGQIAMTRTAGTDMPRIAEVCASPAAVIGQTVDVDVTGLGFFPGPGLEVTSSDADVTIDSFVFQNWSSITATVSVAPGAPPGLSYYDLRVDNPDGDAETGHIVTVTEVPMFGDGFGSGDLSGWSSHVP